MATRESPDQEPPPEDRYLKKMIGIIRSHTHQERVDALFLRIKSRLPELEVLAHELEDAEEDGVYRFYHESNKVFFLQDPVKAAFTLIKEIGGEDDPPNFEYARIVEAGTAHQFSENDQCELGSGDQTDFGGLLAHQIFHSNDDQIREAAGNRRDAGAARHGSGALPF